MRAYLITLICVLLLALCGCSTSSTPAGESPDPSPLNPQEIPTHLPTSPSQGDVTPMDPSLQVPPNLQKLIEKAKEDLAQRSSISTTQINLLEASEVVWPDGSLGCPQKGMEYAQVLTPGYLIRLESGGNTFEYHAGVGGDITYCKNPTPPILGTPYNT